MGREYTIKELQDNPGAGMGAKLHAHAMRAAKDAQGRMTRLTASKAYAKAAGDWCPECGSNEIESNGCSLDDPQLTYQCQVDGCNHQWSPNEN